MADLLNVNVVQRDGVGTANARRTRRLVDQVPGVVYGGSEPPVHFLMEYRRVAKALEQEAFYSQVLNLSLGGKDEKVVLRELQRHPATEKVIHIDFLRVQEDRELHVSVPFHFINEEACVGVKLHGGVIARNLTEIEISCLPKDLPEYFEIDLEPMEVGDAIHLSDLTLPEGVAIVALMHGDDRDDQIVGVHLPRGTAADEEEGEAEMEVEDSEVEEDSAPDETE